MVGGDDGSSQDQGTDDDAEGKAVGGAVEGAVQVFDVFQAEVEFQFASGEAFEQELQLPGGFLQEALQIQGGGEGGGNGLVADEFLAEEVAHEGAGFFH